MPMVQNPMAADPFSPVSNAMSGLAKILLSGPTAEETAAKAAQTTFYTAQAEKARQEAAAKAQEMGAADTIANAVSKMYGPALEAPRPAPDAVGPMPAMSRDQQVAQFTPDLWKGVAQSGKVANIGEIMRAAVANAPGSSDNATIRALAGGGTAIGKDQAVSLPGQEAIREGNFAAEAAIKDADIAGAMARATMEEGGRNSRARMVDDRALVPVITGYREDGTPIMTNVLKSNAIGTEAPVPPQYLKTPGTVAPSDVGKLINERDALPPGDPNRAVYDQRIRQLTTNSPGKASLEDITKANALDQATINLQSVIDTLMPVDPTTGERRVDRSAVVQNRTPGVNIPLIGRVGGGALPWSRGTETRANFLNSFNTLLNLASGQAVTQQEADRKMDEYFPTITDTDEAVRIKLSNLQRLMDSTTGAIRNARPDLLPPRQGGGAPPAQPTADPLEGRTATNPSTGERIIRRNGQWVPAQ